MTYDPAVGQDKPALIEADSSPLATDGSYDVGGLQPGTYRMKFDAAPGMYRTEYWNNARSIETARDVVITGTTPITDLDAVLALAPPVQLTRRPTISGRARVGETLTAGHGAWDVASLRFSYQWRADGSIIPRATGRAAPPHTEAARQAHQGSGHSHGIRS